MRRRITNQEHSPLDDELHQHFVPLFNEMTSTEEVQANSVFKADLLLDALRSDPYLFQREVRGYCPEEILEQLWSIFAKV